MPVSNDAEEAFGPLLGFDLNCTIGASREDEVPEKDNKKEQHIACSAGMQSLFFFLVLYFNSDLLPQNVLSNTF